MAEWAAGILDSILEMGRRCPMTPVDMTRELASPPGDCDVRCWSTASDIATASS